MTSRRHTLMGVVLAIVLAAAVVGPLAARTITLTDADADRVAVISADAPRVSWAAHEIGPGTLSNIYIDLSSKKTMLIRYPLDRIAKGSRVTHAELTVPVSLVSAGEQKVQIRRVLKEWGPGACHDFRMTRPQKLEWAQPGARGVATDRATRPTAIVKAANPGDFTVNVTEDVELWQSGQARNYGWAVTVEDADVFVRVASPVGVGKGGWKLIVTFEAE
jgi:hypothetical protein